MRKKWQIAKKISSDFISKFPEINPIILQLLHSRGITEQKKIDEFLNPDYEKLHSPFLFSDIKKIAARIKEAVKKKEKIFVYGDYDADGVTASALLISCLKKINAHCDIYIPHRENEGYGLNNKAIENIADKGAKLIITVDCGISNFQEVEFAKSLGIEIIITDHHVPPKKLPKCLILNPQADKKYPFKELAGVGVAFKLAQILLKELAEEKNFSAIAFEKWLLDLAAIGTIADCVPLLEENRVIVKYGLIVLNKTKREGLKTLIKKASINRDALDSYNVAFQLSPRINAAGRMNHADAAYKLLMSKSAEKVKNLADELNNTNSDRQKLTDRITKEIISEIGGKLSEKAIIFLKDDCLIGILGLIAGKITSLYNRPSLILTEKNGKITGSGRSIPEFNLIENLEKIKNLFSHFGGHSQACGFTLKDKKLFFEFQEKFLDLVNEKLKNNDLLPVINIAAEIKLTQITWQMFDELNKFKPFGQGNPQPIFLTRNLKVLSSKEVGQNGNHLKIFVNSCHNDAANCNLDCIGFGMAKNWRGQVKAGSFIDLAYNIDENRWNGNRELQLKVVDLRIIS
ncbi:single-stranded-DNA-specific exonuclease RecJ [Candidatus Parcubacteria bacterium]|nr:single-stranded-DNA-specific exonuclease RecJ [Candidatus Parcubacteria bacterium]